LHGAFWVFIAALVAALLWFERPRAASAQSARGGNVTILLTFGLNASAEERWDGTAIVSGGTLVATEGRRFSAGDEITGPGAWKCSTRRDEVAPYADLHYTEMRPGERPPVLFHAVGVYLTLAAGPAAHIAVQTTQGNFTFAVADANEVPRDFLAGRAAALRVATPEKLTTDEYEDDEPSIAAFRDGGLAVAWIAYRDRADRALARTWDGARWSTAEEITPKPGDLFRCSLAVDAAGDLWAFWSEREGTRWHIRGRRKRQGAWGSVTPISGEGSNTFHRAAAGPDGTIYVVWQSFRGGQSDIWLRAFRSGAWSPEMRVSDSPANDWEPAVAAGQDAAYVAWDTYDRGNYDVRFRGVRAGKLDKEQAITDSERFQAHASVAIDDQVRPWIAWDESGANWGKDQGFLLPTPGATPLHQERSIRLAMWDGERWIRPSVDFTNSVAPPMRRNAEHPQIVFDGGGSLVMVFRHWTRRNSRTIGSPMAWENYVARFNGSRWSVPQPLPSSAGSIEKHAAIARSGQGDVWAAWMTDNRPFSTMVPQNADVFAARLPSGGKSDWPATTFQPWTDTATATIPSHPYEIADVKAIRGYTISAGGHVYNIYRGDMHRHTDVSQDFKYDGSLIEVYRYGLDSAAFDYIAATDHQTGFDHEFTWWQNQKLADLFFLPARFTPLFAYERSLRFPNGHRNIVFAYRGVRTLPIPPEEAAGKTGAAGLFEHLRSNRGISMPHSSATDQGTDWRDNDPEVEPLIEIYQGYRTSYEYEGAPRAASTLNQHAQKSGWQPSGFWWNALAKGYKLGVQASSDHWSTHISYACLLAETHTREGLMEAIRKRHAYAATDNIILDFRARTGTETRIMGDAFTTTSAPQLQVRAIGTGAIQQVDIIKNQKFIYTVRPGTRQSTFEFTDQEFGSGESYYYVRVLQENGQLAWSSPIWIKK
jgi:hypothetical protein